jgi:hypothetical protein
VIDFVSAPLLRLSERQATIAFALAGCLQVVALVTWVRTLAFSQLCVRMASSAIVIGWLGNKILKYHCFRLRKNLAVLCEEAVMSAVYALPAVGILALLECSGVVKAYHVVYEASYWLFIDSLLIVIFERRLRGRQSEMRRI